MSGDRNAVVDVPWLELMLSRIVETGRNGGQYESMWKGNMLAVTFKNQTTGPWVNAKHA